MAPLFETLRLGEYEVSNRVALAPLTRGRASPEGVPNELLVEYYTQRASAGLMISEATGISRQGLLWYCAPGIYTKDQIEGWKKVTSAVHAKNGTFFLQLWHMGRQGHSEVSGQPTVAPSAIALKGEVSAKEGKKPAEIPHELTIDEIQAVVEDYGRAAENAIEAGFDGVEVHFANGYLGDLFLQSSTNKRTDKYGGSLENRLKFLEEVLDRILKSLPAGKVGIRFSPNGAYGEVGSADNIETFTAAIRHVSKLGLAYVHVMDGLGFGFHELTEPFTLKMARDIVNSESSSTKIIGNVGYTKESAEERIGSGDADMIAFGRPYIGNPDLVERFKNNWELAESSPNTWWATALGAEGYTTFPTYEEKPEN